MMMSPLLARVPGAVLPAVFSAQSRFILVSEE